MSYQNENYRPGNGNGEEEVGTPSFRPTLQEVLSARGISSDNIQYSRIEGAGTPGTPYYPCDYDACFKSAARYRWLEALFLVMILYLGQTYPGQLRKMFVPQMVSLTGTSAGTVVANNTAFSYPVIFNTHTCTPYHISQCVSEEVVKVHPDCCDALKKGTHPYETVPDEILYVICSALPITIFLLRHLIHVVWLGDKEGVQFRDSLIGYLFAVSFNIFSTNLIKNAIGYPRPNHFALILTASNTHHMDLAKNAWKSFPSGHSSLSMSTMLYTTMILLHDIKRKSNYLTSVARSMLVGLAWIPVFISIFIAATRITNMWHGTTDVLAGLFLGAGWSFLSYRHVLPSNEMWLKAKDTRALSDIADVLSLII